MIDYMWRVIMIDNTGEENATTVALFLLECDAMEWSIQQNNQDRCVVYRACPPKK